MEVVGFAVVVGAAVVGAAVVVLDAALLSELQPTTVNMPPKMAKLAASLPLVPSIWRRLRRRWVSGWRSSQAMSSPAAWFFMGGPFGSVGFRRALVRRRSATRMTAGTRSRFRAEKRVERPTSFGCAAAARRGDLRPST
jgi:hypothetical protein